MKFELSPNWEQRPDFWKHSLFHIITGLEYDELDLVICKNKNSGQGWIEMFRELGFNVTPRWKKFDMGTEVPSVIRCKSINDKSHWYPYIYYDNEIYSALYGGYWASIDSFLEDNKELKITSMIQVWI